ncbi:dual specificity protein phosphatase family protein [Candidatus Uabimicrobium amorphum]|uniref:Phosphatase n=1 Tax=Uabimicrobium amorphum TaxID=2596890 RepID=A0A5S9F0Z1_UABAM|nr:dual specificity protein phosphatase family protein [Candidatus Uabimicrobium amorphum]BBM82115.1 phosphatase [Candidatus Uabimicrobium amorphum]
MNITIRDVFQAQKLLAIKPNHYFVVSISSPRNVHILCGAKDILYLAFDDAEPSREKSARLATKKHCQKALDFLRDKDNLLVHCQAGISRSTAIVLGHLLEKFAKDYRQAIDMLFAIRNCAKPNKFIVGMMCEILGMDNEYDNVIDAIREKREQQGFFIY